MQEVKFQLHSENKHGCMEIQQTTESQKSSRKCPSIQPVSTYCFNHSPRVFSGGNIQTNISIIKYTAEHGKETGKQSTPKHLKHINK